MDFLCRACGAVFQTQAALDRHLDETHRASGSGTGTAPTFFTCSICGQKIRRKDNLQRHMKQFHGRQSSFQCDVCHRSYTSETVLKRHKKRQHKITDTHSEQDSDSDYEPPSKKTKSTSEEEEEKEEEGGEEEEEEADISNDPFFKKYLSSKLEGNSHAH